MGGPPITATLTLNRCGPKETPRGKPSGVLGLKGGLGGYPAKPRPLTGKSSPALQHRLILPDPTAIGVGLSHASRTPRGSAEAWRTAQ